MRSLALVTRAFFNEDRLVDFLKNKQHTLEVVLSGRNPDKRLLEMADYVY